MYYKIFYIKYNRWWFLKNKNDFKWNEINNEV